METAKCFEILANHVSSRNDLFAQVKTHLTAELHYFREQSLCDSDRVHDPLIIKNRWLAFLDRTKKLALFESLKRPPEFWIQIENFVGTRKVSAMNISPHPNDAKTTTTNNGTSSGTNNGISRGIQPEVFFRSLGVKAAGDTKIQNLERMALLMGLKYLETEAKRARPQRDPASIRYAWRAIHGLLEKHQLLENFKRNPILVHQIKFFIADKI